MAIFDYFSIWLVFQLKIVSLLEWKTENVDLLEGNLFRSYKYSLWVLIWQGSLRGSIYRWNVITTKVFIKWLNNSNPWKIFRATSYTVWINLTFSFNAYFTYCEINVSLMRRTSSIIPFIVIVRLAQFCGG